MQTVKPSEFRLPAHYATLLAKTGCRETTLFSLAHSYNIFIDQPPSILLERS